MIENIQLSADKITENAVCPDDQMVVEFHVVHCKKHLRFDGKCIVRI